jgi:hypothetical protein
MLNNIGKGIAISGLLINIIFKWWLGYEWIEPIGFSLLFIGLLVSKKQFIEGIGDYGVHIYYALMTIFMISIFAKWFL